MTTAYLLDTSVASIAWDARNARFDEVQRRLRELRDASIGISVVTLGEVEYGLACRPNLDGLRAEGIRTAMRSYSQVYQIGAHIARDYGRLRAALFERYAPAARRGRLRGLRPEQLVDRTTSRELGIQENDLWIVSTAVTYNLALVTSDDGMRRIHEVAQEVFDDFDEALVTWAVLPSANEP